MFIFSAFLIHLTRNSGAFRRRIAEFSRHGKIAITDQCMNYPKPRGVVLEAFQQDFASSTSLLGPVYYIADVEAFSWSVPNLNRSDRAPN